MDSFELSPHDIETLTHLQIISRLEIGDKICTKSSQIQKNTYWTAYMRYMYGESRDTTIRFVKICVSRSLLLSKKPEIKDKVSEYLCQCITGIENLIETYCGDIRIESELRNVLSTLERRGFKGEK